MKVIELKTVEGKVRYYLADDMGEPVQPVLKYLKFKDNAGYARNTLRMHCIHLKHFFTYLGEAGKDYEKANIDDIAGFLAWLKNPGILRKVVVLRFEPEHQPQTINAMIDTVVMFYDYLLRHEGMENRLSEKLVKFVRNPGGNYRSFLHGIAENRMAKSHILKLPVPRMRLRTISKEDAAELLDSCTNLRDYLLLYLLFETGMRIGEALSLWLEDFDMAGLTITLHDRGEMENLAEIKTVSSPRKLDCTQELMDLFTGYICEYHTAEIHTNHVLLKIKGDMAGKAMDYRDVDNLFRTLRKKTGIRVTPHMFRHTSLSLLYSAGWEPEMLRQRAGHKNIYTTLDTYVHPSEEEVAEAFRKASESLKMPSVVKEADPTLAHYGAFDDKYSRMTEYLSSEGRYWIDNDQWYLEADSFRQADINTGKRETGKLTDFSEYQSEQMKNEMKYFLLYSMKNGLMSVTSICVHYKAAILQLGILTGGKYPAGSFAALDAREEKIVYAGKKPEMEKLYQILKRDVIRFIREYYDDRDEMEKDVWHAARIPGVKISAAAKYQKPSMSFVKIPPWYREMVKRFMSRLVIKRSWSYCTEMMVYLRYFFEAFYDHGYKDGFLEKLARSDIEKYLGWVADDYEGRNATFRSKAVSFIRQYIDYVQLAEYPQAPQKDVNRLIFEDDIPKRERLTDTMGKVKYVLEPVREQLDTCIGEIEPEEMMPVYVLLRETGWRGTDVLNLRYDSCLEHLWNSRG